MARRDDIPDAPAGLAELGWLLERSAEGLMQLLPEPVSSLPEDFGAPGDIDGVLRWLGAGDHVLVVLGVGVDRLVVGVPTFHWECQEPVVDLVSFESLDLTGDVRTIDWFQTRSPLRSQRGSRRSSPASAACVAPERVFDAEICRGGSSSMSAASVGFAPARAGSLPGFPGPILSRLVKAPPWRPATGLDDRHA